MVAEGRHAMSDVALVMLTALAAGGLVLGFGALPWLRAVRAGKQSPDHALHDKRSLQAGLIMAGCLIGCVWLALEAASPGGLVGQRPLLEQLVPVALAVVLAGCLVVFAWQPAWVSRELRGVAVGLVVAGGIAVVLSGTGAIPLMVAALLAAAACLMSSQLLR
jgi:hypothetical protein